MRMGAESGPGLQHNEGTKPPPRHKHRSRSTTRTLPTQDLYAAAALNPATPIKQAARRKANSVHVHVTSARPTPCEPVPIC